MKIALVNPEYPALKNRGHGGIATYIYNIANAMADSGHAIYLFVRDGTKTDTLHESVKVIVFNREHLSFVKKILYKLIKNNVAWDEEYSFGLRKAIYNIHNKNHLDIVDIPEYNGLAVSFKPPNPFKIIINFRTPRIIVNQYNGITSTFLEKQFYNFEKRALKNTDIYRTSSNALKTKISEIYKIPLEKIKTIRNPMDITPFEKNKKNDTNSDSIQILFVGRLEKRKGIDLVHSAIPDILKLSPKVKIVFVGDAKKGMINKFHENIGQLLGKEELEKVFFVGLKDRYELFEIYSHSHIFIFPSLFDNSPNALLEAMAAKLPIVASNCGGVNELIRDGENGLLFPVNNKKGFIKKIKTLIDNPDFANELGIVAKNDIKTIFSPQIIAEKTLTFYKNILSDRSV